MAISNIMRPLAQTKLALHPLGFGAASLGNLYQAMSDETAYNTLQHAFKCGINHFDTAPYYGYGLSEQRLGKALREHKKEHYVLSSKVGRRLKPSAQVESQDGFCSPLPFSPFYDYSYDGVMRSFEDSLQRLGLNEIDILYLHDLGQLTHGENHDTVFKEAMEGGVKALESLRAQGVVKAIGLGVNEYQVCEQAMNYAGFDCFLLAGRYTLLEQHALNHFLPRCQQENVSVIIGGPYNSGILATGVQHKESALYYNYAPASPPIIQRVAQLEAICIEYNIPLPAAALQFPLAHPAVSCVIPGLNSPQQVALTAQYMQVDIPLAFWQELQQQNLLHADAPIAQTGPLR